MDAHVESALREIADANDGKLTPDDVVMAASNPDSPLHGHFTWDDHEAAAKHRRNEARFLIRSVTMTVTTETISFKVPSYVRNTELPRKEAGYIAIARVKDDRDVARESALREFLRARSALTRAQSVAAYLGMQDDVGGVLEMVEALSRRVQEERPAGTA